MALNKYMHPRNIYKNKKPDFKALALKYPDFRQPATQSLTGQVSLDFKNPDCLRALSLALLKEDFDLDVQLPLDHLIPTIPLRLNYILWLEDILGQSEDINGIDIGTGASCVYPLIGCRRNNWKFLATESDAVNVEFAQNNVDKNGMSDQITVVQVDPSKILSDVLPDDNRTYDFCMCNPPFFASHLEAWGLQTTRSDDRPEPMSTNTPNESESVVSGGEVDFISRIVADSVKLKDKIRVYTSMVGKKASLSVIKQLLQSHKIEHFATTEFYQGRTMRWGIAWSFDSTVEFPKAPSKQIRKEEKVKAPLVYVVPPSVCSEKFTVANVTKKLKTLLIQLKIHCKEEKGFASWWSVVMTAYENTWSHQRRKRREKMRESITEKSPRISTEEQSTSGDVITSANGSEHAQKENSNDLSMNDDCQHADSSQNEHKSENECPVTEQRDDSNKNQLTENVETVTSKDTQCENSSHDKSRREDSTEKEMTVPLQTDCQVESSSREGISRKDRTGEHLPDKDKNLAQSVSLEESYLVRCHLCVKRSGKKMNLEMKWMDGQKREHMHQIMQYLKNHLK